jgi:hypothetical protein
VDARALVARLSREAQELQGREILAPLLPGGRIRTRLGGLVYEFRPQSPFVGWGHFRPLDARTAEPVGEALPWERAAYLELFPLLRVVLLWPDPAGGAGGTWWALPYNGSDTRQRFGLDPFEPLPVRLCDPTDGAERFARVLARVDGRTLLFDGPDPLADPAHAEWLRDALAAAEAPERFRPGLAASERHALLLAQRRALELADRAEEIPAAIGRAAASNPAGRERNPRRQRELLHPVAGTARLERGLRRALEKAEATLLGYSATTNPDGTPAGIVVEWSDSGGRHRYRSVLDPSLDVVSSGICLSGRDGDFDLTSLVSVMAAAAPAGPRPRRPGGTDRRGRPRRRSAPGRRGDVARPWHERVYSAVTGGSESSMLLLLKRSSLDDLHR